MLAKRRIHQTIPLTTFFALTGSILLVSAAEAQQADPGEGSGWRFRPHAGLDLNFGTLGSGDTALDEEGEFDYALGYGARLGLKFGPIGLEGRAWYSEPDADFPVFDGLDFVDQFPASTDVEMFSIHGSFDVYRGDKFEVYLSGGYGKGTLEFEFDDPAIIEFGDGEVDIAGWFGEVGVPVEVVNHVQVVPYVQLMAWEFQDDDGDQVDGTETLIGSFAGVTVRGIW